MKSHSGPSNASARPVPGAPTPPKSGWRESLPFFVIGGVSVAVAAVLIASQSTSSLGRLPVWTYLLAIGSISLVGGTVGSLVGEPISDLPRENDLVGPELIVVSRSRWTELNKMERWVEGRLTTPTEIRPPAAAIRPPPSAAAARPIPPAARKELPVPTMDELLADLPVITDEQAANADLWTETEDSREVPPPPRGPRTPAPSARPTPEHVPASRRTPTRVPRKAAPRGGARAEIAPTEARPAGPELEQLLTDLESEATRALEERQDEITPLEPDGLRCAHCRRSIGITEPWENCEECLATYCDRCRGQLAKIGDRRLCPSCQTLPIGGARR